VSSGDVLARALTLDEASSLGIARWASVAGTPPCFACCSAVRDVGQTNINIIHDESGGARAFLTVICRACVDHANHTMATTEMTTGETPTDTFRRFMGIDVSPSKMS
jgi:hypothetical protein